MNNLRTLVNDNNQKVIKDGYYEWKIENFEQLNNINDHEFIVGNHQW